MSTLCSRMISSRKVAPPIPCPARFSALRPLSTRCVQQRHATGPQLAIVQKSLGFSVHSKKRANIGCNSASGPAEPVEIKTVPAGEHSLGKRESRTVAVREFFQQNDRLISAEKKESVLLLGLLFAGWYGANTFFNM
jgi:hypothetical protein